MTIEDFLYNLYRLASLDQETAIDFLMDHVDKLLCDGKFKECDDLLQQVQVQQLTTGLMRTILTMTKPAKNRLPSRGALYLAIEARMTHLRGKETTARVLANLD